jgi:hypothetical protein
MQLTTTRVCLFGLLAVVAATNPGRSAAAAESAGRAGEFCITEYGGVGDGTTPNTAAIQKAVDACAAAGGGRVVVPAGTFVSGPIFLKSNIEFHLMAGAVLRGSRTIADYPLLDCQAQGYHIDRWWHASLLTGTNLENVAITGRGVIDGQGDVWWKARDAGQLKFIRPMTVFLFDCERVRIDGVKIIDSPQWTTVSILCRNMTFHDVSVRNIWNTYHNCDGINFVSCSNVRIANCSIDTGDDGITLKSLPDFGMVTGGFLKNNELAVDYSKPRIPCENFTITNCVVEHAHSGVGIWAEVIGGMRNIVVSNCVFDGTRVGIKIARWPPPGGFMKDIRVSNIVMRRVEVPLEVSSFIDPKSVGPGPDQETSPQISNIHISNITATKARVACQALGLPKMPLRDISFSHIRIEADRGFEIRDAENVLLDDVTVDCPGPAVIAKNVRNLEIRRLDAARPQADVPAVELANCTDAWLHGCRARPGSGPFAGTVGENPGLVLGDAPVPLTQAPVQPSPTWSTVSYAYSGSSMWRKDGNRNAFLPVPEAVMATIRKEWDDRRINGINGVQRLESGARPDVVLPPGDRREIYIIMVWGVPETLLIAEDGELLRKAADFDYKANLQ